MYAEPFLRGAIQEEQAAAQAQREAEQAEATRASQLEKRRARDREYQMRKRLGIREAKEAARKALECAWHQCPEPHKENSKYCSRGCSNKNARLRAKQRKDAA
jgi:hypothetical protein